MNHTRFVVLMLIAIALLLLGVAYERYQTCQEKGGVYCDVVGPKKRGIILRLPFGQ